MSGIYIHIPFCKQACYYCNFHFSTTQKNKREMIESIVKEAALRKDYLPSAVATVYFGGGTPSLLAINDLRFLIDELRKNYQILPDAEITLEANPDDISEDKLLQWKELGINRLSIGIQSFQNKDLQWMNRAHSAEHAIQSLSFAKKYFENITIDLIYGSPLLTDEDWQQNLETIASFNIPHISCYALTVEPNTALHKMIAQHKKDDVDTNKQSRHFEMLCKWATQNGYEHYEISNFAKPNFRSKHNSSYWKGLSYIGLGPSAHSFNGISRQWNISNNALYMKSIAQNMIPYEEEILTATQQLNETIMIQLRTIEGIDFSDNRWKMTNESIKNKIIQQAKKWEQTNHLIVDENRIYLTDKGKFFADGIAADLFQD